MSPPDLPPAARALLAAVRAAVTAAAAADPDRLRAAALELSRLDGERTGVLLGEVLRRLLEEAHPDGLDGDDIRALIDGCLGAASPWLPEVDRATLLIILAGALGIHPEEYEQVPRPSAPAIATHASLLVSELLGGSTHRLDHYLSAALAEIARAELTQSP